MGWKPKQQATQNSIVYGNCSAHPHISSLDCIELVFLSTNTTSEIQPCDQGIIKTSIHTIESSNQKFYLCEILIIQIFW